MKDSITSRLGIHGLKNLDAAILSAIATNSTVLLIGPHGSAKTMLAQKVAENLDCTFRHYNTSLLNYDDLVGYPVPDRENRELHFIQTPGTIWDAEFVLFDEISRARPEIQNKVFPIVHEHRVQGIELARLHHCWAAMNPPSDGEEDDDNNMGYSGSWSLDVALADRFRFVLQVPGFNELDARNRGKILLGENGDRGSHPTLPSLVAATRKQLKDSAACHRSWAARYVSFLTPLLEKACLPISGRRARFLFENILALFSSEQVLFGKSEIGDAALRAVVASLPHSASGKAVDQGKVLLAHKRAAQDAGEPEGSALLKVKSLGDPVQQVECALLEKLDRNVMTQIVSDAFASLNIVERYAWVYRVFPRLSEDQRVSAAVLEMLAEVESRTHEGAHSEFTEAIDHADKRWKHWEGLSQALARAETGGDMPPEQAAVARALFFIEKEEVTVEQVRKAFEDIERRIATCAENNRKSGTRRARTPSGT
jgi:MoxR-like ATPase